LYWLNLKKIRFYRNFTLMGSSKNASFSDEQNKLALLAKALAHPARIAILQYLMQQKSCVCGDIVDELPLAQATVSQHLKELKAVGIIQGEIEGTKTCYCISPEGWNMLKSYFEEFLNTYQAQQQCC
jgi:predicted transcriptional regulator